MGETTQSDSAVTTAPRSIAVICQQTKDLYVKNPKLIQRLPKEQRAYWYWFLKQHQTSA